MTEPTGPEWAPDWEHLSTQGLTLSIGWETGATKTVHVRTLPLDSESGEDLRAAVRDCVNLLRDDTPVPYNPDMELEESTYAYIDRAQLADDTSIFHELEQASPPEGSVDDLGRGLLFYAITVGPANARVVLIRRYNPTANLKKKWFGTFGDELSPVDEQLVSLDLSHFDVVLVVGAGLLVFDLKQYERLFRDSPELLARTPAKVEELSAQRALTDAAKEVLAAAALRNSRIRSRLHAIVASGRLEHVDDARLEQAMVRFGLDPDVHMTADGIAFDDEHVMPILELLNEDLSIGPLTDTEYVITRKVPRP